MTMTVEAMEMLAEMLADGPKLVTDIRAKAMEMDISFSSLQKAKDRMLLKSSFASGRWWWSVPGQLVTGDGTLIMRPSYKK
jgi:hypothetical protein